MDSRQLRHSTPRNNGMIQIAKDVLSKSGGFHIINGTIQHTTQVLRGFASGKINPSHVDLLKSLNLVQGGRRTVVTQYGREVQGRIKALLQRVH